MSLIRRPPRPGRLSRELLTSGFLPQSTPTLGTVSQSVARPMRTHHALDSRTRRSGPRWRPSRTRSPTTPPSWEMVPHPRTASRRSRTVPGDNGHAARRPRRGAPEFISRSAVAIAASIPGAERQVIDAACSPSFDANPRYCLDIKQFQDFQDRVLRMAQENATVSDHAG